MRKKLISVFLGLSVMAAAVGCSSKPKETEKATEAKTEAKTEAVTEAPEETEAATEAAAIEEVVTEAMEKAQEAVSEAAKAGQEAVSEAVEAVSEAVEAAQEAVTEAAEAVSEAAKAAEPETEAVTETVEAATEAAEEETEAVTEAATEAAEEETEAVTEAATEAAEEETEAVTEAATEAAEEETEAVTEAATEAAEEETEAVTEAATEAAEEETEAVQQGAGIEEGTSAVVSASNLSDYASPKTKVVPKETEAAEEETEAAEEETEAVTEAATEAAEEETEAAEQGAGIEEGTSAVVSTSNLSDYATPKTKVVPKETEAAEEETEAAEEETEAVTEAAEEDEESVTESAEEDEEDLTEEAEEEAKVDIRVKLDEEATEGTVDDFDITDDDIVILFNNDVHGGISADKEYSGSARSLGYAAMAGVKADVAERAAGVTTVDLGDAIQGSVVTTESVGQDAMDLMEMIGYDIQIPGNHDFDYEMDVFMDYASSMSGEFLAANFVDAETDEPILDPYTLETYDVNGVEVTIGYVGMCTPETISKSSPTYFQDEDGNYLYSFDAETPENIYEDVQNAVDEAYADGADFVVALGHMGDTGVEKGWSSVDVINNTTGISVFLDGHAHSVIPGRVEQNKDGEDVLLASTGTKLEHIGLLKMNVEEDGTVTLSTGLVNEITDDEKKTDEYNEVYEKVQEIEDGYAYLFVVEGTVDYDLVCFDPEDPDVRIIRNSETNLGNFLSDIYLNYFDADIAVMNGGSIRANIDEGEINYMDIIAVYPWNTTTGVVEVSGQVILDMLEMGARLYPEECGGWIHAAGITYMLDSTIESSVNVNSAGEFVSVDGEYRIKNVMVGDEPLDLEKTYRLAINTYYTESYGDGMTMFKGCKVVVPAEGEDEIVDHDVVVSYLTDTLNGVVPEDYADPYGQGRITIITEENKDLLDEAVEAVTEAAEEETEAAEEDEAADQGEGIGEGTGAVISAANLSDYASPKTKVAPAETEAAEDVTEAATE